MRKFVTFCLSLLLLVSLAVPAAASEYVIDDAGLLTPEQRSALNDYAEAIAGEFGVAVYMMTVDDYSDYGHDPMIFDVLWNYYHNHALGYGENREGMILMLSMRYRDYATFFYGDKTLYAFNDFGQEQLEGYFLGDFGENDWYGGFWNYLTYSEDFLSRAAAGDPVRESPWGLAMLFVLTALFLSFVVTLILWKQMGNVAFRKDAAEYRTAEGLVLTRRTDRFLTQTMTRRKLPQSTSGGGSGSRSHSGGGGRGRSGKF